MKKRIEIEKQLKHKTGILKNYLLRNNINTDPVNEDELLVEDSSSFTTPSAEKYKECQDEI